MGCGRTEDWHLKEVAGVACVSHTSGDSARDLIRPSASLRKRIDQHGEDWRQKAILQKLVRNRREADEKND